eukprot:1726927-Rhodomonas_salina.1
MLTWSVLGASDERHLLLILEGGMTHSRPSSFAAGGCVFGMRHARCSRMVGTERRSAGGRWTEFDIKWLWGYFTRTSVCDLDAEVGSSCVSPSVKRWECKSESIVRLFVICFEAMALVSG